MKRQKGFTLAEVLITLGIIGVVAAMTLPTLISNYQKVVLKTQYKKGVSILANAIQMEMAKNETPGDLFSTPLAKCWENGFGSLNSCLQENSNKLFSIILDTSDTNFERQIEDLVYDYNYDNILSGIFFPPAYAETIQPNHPWQMPYFSFMTGDSIIYGYMGPYEDWNNEPMGILVMMDANGIKKPNKFGHDMFVLVTSKRGKVADYTKCYIDESSCTMEELENIFDVKVPEDIQG